MDDGIGQLIALIILILFSGYFSATETAFTGINRIRIKNLASDGNKKAETVLKLSEDYDRLLSTILIGNNIVNIAATAIATALFIRLCGGNVSKGTTIATIVITVVVLVFGEITPKSIAKDRPEQFALFSAPLLRVFIVILYPLNFLFSLWKKFVSLFIKPSDDKGITEEELLTIVDEAENEGDMEADEAELVRNAIEFSDIEVGDILTPRVDIIAVEDNEKWEEIDRVFKDSGYSRLPVYHESIDNIIGVVNQKDYYMTDKMSLKSITKPVENVVPTMKISQLLVKLQKKKLHMAVVVDEYGGIDGIVTLEDIIEELVGEIWDEHDEVIEEFRKVREGEYRILCSASLDDMFERFEMDNAFEDIPTVSGWVIENLKQLPKPGDRFEYENLSVTVTKCDSRHVLEIKVKVKDEDIEKE